MAQHVGLDLAWSTRARTGIAAVDETGRLATSGVVTTDDEIRDWLATHAPDPDVVAVDAPLIVTNPTGQRRCERLIGSAFGRYHASAHVSNLSRPYFDPPRAATLARTLGWDTDPASANRPLCLEVYPHPAMVGLWQLPRVIPYKARKGRRVADRQVAFGRLLGHLESVTMLQLTSHPRWAELTGLVAGAQRQADLERIEDEIDAIFCAHLAWLWRRDGSGLQVYGSPDDGYIVAPPPPTHAAAPRG